MAQNAWNQARMCLLGLRQKMVTPPPPAPKFWKFCITEAVFAQNTYKSWRKPHQISYSNRKQPMGISNLGLKIWPEVEFWPFLRMRSGKLAKNTWNRGPETTHLVLLATPWNLSACLLTGRLDRHWFRRQHF